MAKRSAREAQARPTSAVVKPLFGASWHPLDIEQRPDDRREQGYVRKVRPQSDNQRALMEAIDSHNLAVALGPAGTGKTYLAVTAAVDALEAGRVGRIVLTRPAVEAGESLGFLPGDMHEKLAPYLRPLYDALNERLGGKRVRQLMTEGAIEIAKRARGTPRVAVRLLRRVRDFAGEGAIDAKLADVALKRLDIDSDGLDLLDRRYLIALIENYGGGPVGVDTLAAALAEARDAIEDVIEPYLIQQGFLQRTPRGRIATLAAFRHLGLQPPAQRGSPDLFEA